MSLVLNYLQYLTGLFLSVYFRNSSNFDLLLIPLWVSLFLNYFEIFGQVVALYFYMTKLKLRTGIFGK